MANTRGNLVAAKIYSKTGGITVECMFNPYEYTISRTNTYTEQPRNATDRPTGEYFRASPLTLRMELFFDTYESGQDVSKITRKLWKLMDAKTNEQVRPPKKVPPPTVVFEWGVFEFAANITNMTQRYTLFKVDGTPVRAKVDITFSQYMDPEDYPSQNPTSGGGDIERVWRVVAGDRLDAIAYEVYREASKWRIIAERNRIRDPLALQPGLLLIIPNV